MTKQEESVKHIRFIYNIYPNLVELALIVHEILMCIKSTLILTLEYIGIYIYIYLYIHIYAVLWGHRCLLIQDPLSEIVLVIEPLAE